jgi:pSer/pThr/pTyr-binding forkhead associated (FHA) protein
MSACYGKLVLINPNGPCQEFVLSKSNVSMGRNITNDVVLNDGRVSRNHARLECSPAGVILSDMGSSNGTRLNGMTVERATLKPGDTISLGGQQIKYKVEDPSEDVGITKIDTQAQLDQSIEAEVLPVMVNETSNPSLVVFTNQVTWQFDLSNKENTSIGRDESCDVFIDSVNVSRRHAEVQLEGICSCLRISAAPMVRG